MKKILLPILAALLLISGLPVAAADTEAAALRLTGLDKKLTDGNHLTAASFLRSSFFSPSPAEEKMRGQTSITMMMPWRAELK